MRIAFLGLGKMGSALAQHLVQSGEHEVTVWNRRAEATKPLAALGARAASEAADAARGAEIVFSMLLDDAAVEDVILKRGVLDAMGAGSAHVSLSTISAGLADRLDADHQSRGQHFVSSPVFGRPGVASEGKLWLAVAGAEDQVDRVKPLLNLFSRGLTVVGKRPSMANVAKVAGNFLITATIAALSESFTVAESKGVDADVFLAMINNALFQSPFYANYGKLMLHPPAEAGATVKLGAKDTGLFREVAESAQVRTPLADLYANHMRAAIDAGLGEQDWAAGYLEQVRRRAQD